MTTEEEERIEAGLDLTGEERSEARATVRHVSDPARQRRLYAQAYARLRESKRRDASGAGIPPAAAVIDLVAIGATRFGVDGQTPAEFPPVFPPVLVKPKEPEPDRPALTVTRRGRMLRLETGGLVAFIDPLDVASVNSTSRLGYTDAHAPLTTISIRGGLCIQVPQYTADEVFAALDDDPGNRAP